MAFPIEAKHFPPLSTAIRKKREQRRAGICITKIKFNGQPHRVPTFPGSFLARLIISIRRYLWPIR